VTPDRTDAYMRLILRRRRGFNRARPREDPREPLHGTGVTTGVGGFLVGQTILL
jgi:hypothetical protein